MLKVTDILIEDITPALEKLIEKAWTIGYEQARKDIITGEVPTWLEN
jgi:hypothetical protein